MASLRLVLIAGETSGDVLGASLAAALKRQRPDLEISGMTGPRMRAAGVEPWFDIDELSVMGLTEVLKHLPRLLKLQRRIRQRILDWPADALVTIDAPDFNLSLARQIKTAGLPTIHYVSPTVWAWRAGRIPKIARALDRLLTLFPFEPELYAAHGLQADFVGHPLADELAAGPDRAAARSLLDLGHSTPVIALLPGSRSGELQQHVRLLGETALQLHRRRPKAEIIMLLSSESQRALALDLLGNLAEQAHIRLFSGQTRAGLEAADVAIAASGTVTLEAFLLECPLTVFYRLAPSSYYLARGLKLMRSRHVALPNILSGQALVPERLQQAATPDRLSTDVETWLNEPERIAAYRAQSRGWRARLAQDAGERAAACILETLGRG